MGNAPGKFSGPGSGTTCDGGSLTPNGIYAEDAQDFDTRIVQRLILGRQLAPFYVGGDEPDPADSPPSKLSAQSDGSEDSASTKPSQNDDDGWWSYNLRVAQQAGASATLSQDTTATANTTTNSNNNNSNNNNSTSKSGTPARSIGSHSRNGSSNSFSAMLGIDGSAGQHRHKGGHSRKGSGLFHLLKGSSAGSSSSGAPGGGRQSTNDMRSPSPLSAASSSANSDQLLGPDKLIADALSSGHTKHSHQHQQLSSAEECRRLLRRFIECPICFLYYPQNINYTRCCHKPVCTECFVQIKRKLDDDTVSATHCPYCVQQNFGVVYYAPEVTSGAARTNYMKHRPQLSSQLSASSTNHHLRLVGSRGSTEGEALAGGRMRSQSSSLSREPVVVMSDDIRPNLLAELRAEQAKKRREQERQSLNMATVAAAAQRISARNARRASASAAGQQGAANEQPRGLFSRSRRDGGVRLSTSEYGSYIRAMREQGGTNLEEFLVQEAIRMSLAEHGEDGQVTTQQDPACDNAEAAGDAVSANGRDGGAQSQQEQPDGSSPSASDTGAAGPGIAREGEGLVFGADEIDTMAGIADHRQPLSRDQDRSAITAAHPMLRSRNTMEDLAMIAVEQGAVSSAAAASASASASALSKGGYVDREMMGESVTELSIPVLQPLTPVPAATSSMSTIASSTAGGVPMTPPVGSSLDVSVVPSLSPPPKARRRPPPPPPPAFASARGRSSRAGSASNFKQAAGIEEPNENSPSLIFF